MKKLVLPILLLLAGAFILSCQKSDDATDDQLIAAIADSQAKISIEPAALPADAQAYLSVSYFDSYIESASEVRGKGFEVTLGDEERLWFDRNGRTLEDRGGRGRPNRPCAGFGRTVMVEDLPSGIADYLALNYPNVEIVKAKKRGDHILVLLRGHHILVFDSAGAFVEEAWVFRACQICVSMTVGELPAAVEPYITEHYAGAEIKRICQIRGRYVVGIVTADGRKILAFDGDGNFLFERG